MGIEPGRVALVTGGGSGIGRAAALAFAREKALVALAGRDEGKGGETVSMIEASGGSAFFLKTDVSKEADVKRLVEETVSRYGRLDYAFNNAGIDGRKAELIDLA